MKSRFLENLERMPGPVWLFGAYGFYRLCAWAGALLPALCCGTGGWSLAAIGVQALTLAGVLVPSGLFVLLVMRKTAVLPFVKWYAALQALAHGITLLSMFVMGSDPPPTGDYASVVRAVMTHLLWAGLWLGFLYYTERSAALARLFPPPSHRVLWWVVLALAVLVFFTM